MDLGITDLEVWNLVITILAGSVGGIFTVAIATSRRINQLDNITTDVAMIKRVLFKESGGLNLLSEDMHTEKCRHTLELWGKDIDRIEEKFDAFEQKVDSMADKLDLVVSSASAATRGYAEEMRRMSDIIESLVKEWRKERGA